VVSIQLVDCQPDNTIVDVPFGFLFQGLRDFPSRFPAVAQLPNKRRRLIQTMRPVTIAIVNEYLVGQFVNYKTVFSGTRINLAIGFHNKFSFRNSSCLLDQARKLSRRGQNRQSLPGVV
jgi:hypothetical protein